MGNHCIRRLRIEIFGKPIYKKSDYNEVMPAWTKAHWNCQMDGKYANLSMKCPEVINMQERLI